MIEDLSTNLIQMAEISDPRLEPNIDETEMETSFSVVKYTVAGERGSHYAMKFFEPVHENGATGRYAMGELDDV